LGDFISLVGPNRAVQILGVKLVGVNAENGKQLLFSLAFIALTLLLGRAMRAFTGSILRGRDDVRSRFWARQGVQLATAVLMILGLVSIWFDDPTRLTTALGLLTAGLAFALQRVVTAIAGYFVILRGRTFNVGDRITMGGVRGDVIELGFIQTTIMEMGQPPMVQGADPAMWVRARQYSGRIVTVTNAKIFEEPVYNYTRDFPFIWEEITLAIGYNADRARAEQILLDVAHAHAGHLGPIAEESIRRLGRRYILGPAEMAPKVYYNLTTDALELTIRFIAESRGVRDLKDSMGRDILKAMQAAGIGMATTSFEIVGLPPVQVRGTDSLG